MKNNDVVQTFNYHTHTRRCGHAGLDGDVEYVKAAREAGILQIGFSDHVPLTEYEFQDVNQQMHISDMDEYIKSIRQLQQDYPDMKILCGLEAEYTPMKEQYLGDLRKRLDYMILGQHYTPVGTGVMPSSQYPVTSNYPILYAEVVIQAMKTGMFDIVAHPDIFMEYRDKLKNPDDKRDFLVNAEKASEMICEAALSLGIPLELNFGPASQKKRLEDGQLAYPHSIFWDVAAKKQVPVMFGVDAHNPQQFLQMRQSLAEIERFIDIRKLKLISNGYNPLVARKSNPELNRLFKESLANSSTYETKFAEFVTSMISGRIDGQNLTISDLPMISEQMLKGFLSDKKNTAVSLVGNFQQRMQEIVSDSRLSEEEKDYLIRRERDAAENHTLTYESLNALAVSIHHSIEQAVSAGCKNKEEVIERVSQLTELENTDNQLKKDEINKELEGKQLDDSNPTLANVNKGPVLKYKPNNKNNPYGSPGFITMTYLLIILALLIGIIIGVGYVFYKING